jgi:hypothetical protein
MNHIENLYIDEFRGYLKCLSRLCANEYVFGASCFEAKQDIDVFAKELVEFWGQGDEYIEPSNYEYFGSTLIESPQLFQEIESFIFNGILERESMPNQAAKEYAERMLTEDINEYYGLVSVSLNEEGVFHPLLSNNVYTLNIQNKNHERALYFIVKIENVYVLTHFLKKANHEK